MGLASYYFTKNVDRTWRLLENLEAGMIGMNTGKCPIPESEKGPKLIPNRQFLGCRVAIRGH
jgi:acyl-CoA reductase-like NAD-dependent aldehyde dehydrogenase